MDTHDIERKELEDSEHLDYVPFAFYRHRSYTVTVTDTSPCQDRNYYRNKARIAASKISKGSDVRYLEATETRARTNSFSSYFLPTMKTMPRMEATEEFWNRYRRQPRTPFLGYVKRYLFPIPRAHKY